MTDAGASLPGLPEPLLAPLLEATGEVLRGLDPPDVPASARRLATFDRRGLSTPAARSQLRRLLEAEDGFREQVVQAFLERPEAAAAEAGWEREMAAERVAEAAAAGRLPLLASVLWAGRPPGFEFGLGLALAAFESEGREAGAQERTRSLETRVAALEEAGRRAEAARLAAQEEVSHLEAELREERRARRSREQLAAGELEEAQRRAGELEATLEEARRRAEEAETRARREAERADRAEEREAREAPAASGPEAASEEWEREARGALAEAARHAAQLAAALEDLVSGGRAAGPGAAPAGQGSAPATSPSPAPRPDRAREPRRTRVHVPPGMWDDTPEAAETMVRTPGVAVVVDGYNVSMLAWPDARPAEQRERLCSALAELHLRARCQVTVVFDGAEVPGVRPPRRPGLQVVFSAPGQEADEVVVGQASARPPAVPVLVVSSDAWVRSRAEAEGAQVLPSAVFLDLLRR